MHRRLNATRPASVRLRSPSMTLALAVCLIAGVLVVSPASATPRWAAVRSPRPPGYAPVYLYGVSCPSTTSCFAVGYAYPPNGSVRKTFVEHWDGSTWSIMTSPNPTGSGNSFLNGVSCRTTRSCFAVGWTREPDSKTLVERWTRNRWSIVPSPTRRAPSTPF